MNVFTILGDMIHFFGPRRLTYSNQHNLFTYNKEQVDYFLNNAKKEIKDDFCWAYNNIYKNQLKVKPPEFVDKQHRDLYYIMFDLLLKSDNDLCHKRRDENNVLSSYNNISILFLMIIATLSVSFFMKGSILTVCLASFFYISLTLFFVFAFMRFKQCSENVFATYWVDHSENQRINYFMGNKGYIYKSKDPHGKLWRQYLIGLKPLDLTRTDYGYIPIRAAVISNKDSEMVSHGKNVFGHNINYGWWSRYKTEISQPKYVNSNHENEFKLMFNYLYVVDEKIKYLSRRLDADNFAWNFNQCVFFVACVINAFGFFLDTGSARSWMTTVFFVAAFMFVWTTFSRVVYNFKNNAWTNNDAKWDRIRREMLIEDCPYYGGKDPLGVPWVDYFRDHKISRKQPSGRLTKEQERYAATFEF